jgi:hypothetical protein
VLPTKLPTGCANATGEPAPLPICLMGLGVIRVGGRSPFSSHLRSLMAPRLGNGLLWLATSANLTCE